MNRLAPQAWRGYRSSDFPHASWAIEGEVLHALPGAEAVSLISCEAFGDFELSLEWRLPPGGNSGVLYRVSEEGEAPWHSGPEMQLLDDAGHPDGRVPETRCGALYGLYAPEVDARCAPEGFNMAVVRLRGSMMEHWLNGVCVVRRDMASADFRSRVARSKFRDYLQFARASRGHIVLQHHGDEAWFRNVRLQ